MHQRSQSILPSRSNRICKASRTRSKVPSSRQELNRWYIDCHGPYRPGRSRHGAPVRSTQRIPVENLPSRPTARAAGSLWEQILDEVPLVVAQFVSSHADVLLHFFASKGTLSQESYRQVVIGP